MSERADIGAQIAAAFTALHEAEDVQPDVCPACGGDGWYVGHEDECYDSGDCVCSGVQVQCECASPSSDGAA